MVEPEDGLHAATRSIPKINSQPSSVTPRREVALRSTPNIGQDRRWVARGFRLVFSFGFHRVFFRVPTEEENKTLQNRKPSQRSTHPRSYNPDLRSSTNRFRLESLFRLFLLNMRTTTTTAATVWSIHKFFSHADLSCPFSDRCCRCIGVRRRRAISPIGDARSKLWTIWANRERVPTCR
jgi:hypothetical protein